MNKIIPESEQDFVDVEMKPGVDKTDTETVAFW